MRLVELVHEEERVGCKKISVGVYILKNTHEEGHAHFLWKKKKRFCINKCIWKKWWEWKKKNEEKRKKKAWWDVKSNN